MATAKKVPTTAPAAANLATGAAAADSGATTGAVQDNEAAAVAAAVGTIQPLINSAPRVAEAAYAAGVGADVSPSALQDVVEHGVRIVSRPASFRRAGREFGKEPVEIPLRELPDGVLEVLEAEPELVVTRIYMAIPEEPAEPAAS